MFVPRSVQQKGTSEKARGVVKHAEKKSKTESERKADNLTSADPPKAEPELRQATLAEEKAEHSAKTVADDKYLKQLLAGIELIFTDYAHQEKARAQWLKKHYRNVNGEEQFVHLQAILLHENISTLKPAATQTLLQQALRKLSSDYLELSQNGYYVRRRPSTYPLPFVPEESFELVYDNGDSYWEARTVYVEPHTRDLFKTPAKVAHWLRENGKMKEKWLPIQAVIPRSSGYGLVVLSGNVTHDDVWRKWRKQKTPAGWLVEKMVEYGDRIRMERRRYDHYPRGYDSDGYDSDGYDSDGYDSYGYDSDDDRSRSGFRDDHPDDEPANPKKRGRTEDEDEDEDELPSIKRNKAEKAVLKDLPIRRLQETLDRALACK